MSIRDLSITFKTGAGPVNAIRDVNIDLPRGTTLAVVGESGSGKSVTFKAAMGILASNSVVNSGSIVYNYRHNDGTPATVDILNMKTRDIRRHINGKRIAMIFQDPMTSLDPTMPIGKQIMEGMIWHYKTPKQQAWEKAFGCSPRWASKSRKSGCVSIPISSAAACGSVWSLPSRWPAIRMC